MQSGWFGRGLAIVALAAAGLTGPLAGAAIAAQVQTVDPNDAIDADLARPARPAATQPKADAPLDQGYDYGTPDSATTSSS